MTEPGRFDELLRLWTDGEASPAELKELGAALRENPERRRELVRSVMVEVTLYGRYAASAGAGTTLPKSRSRAWEVAAAALVLALSVFLLGRLFLMKKAVPNVAVQESEGQSALPKLTPLPAPDPALEKLVRLLDRAKFSLPQAVEIAAQGWPGVPVKTELSEEDGMAVWTVVLALERKSREVEIDAASGRILEAEEEKGDQSAVATALKVPIRTAVEKALAAVAGRPVEAEAEVKKGRLVVEVKILHDGAIREVLVDGETGDVLK
jgi:uncharacterized membrane protein YkoI